MARAASTSVPVLRSGTRLDGGSASPRVQAARWASSARIGGPAWFGLIGRAHAGFVTVAATAGAKCGAPATM